MKTHFVMIILASSALWWASCQQPRSPVRAVAHDEPTAAGVDIEKYSLYLCLGSTRADTNGLLLQLCEFRLPNAIKTAIWNIRIADGAKAKGRNVWAEFADIVSAAEPLGRHDGHQLKPPRAVALPDAKNSTRQRRTLAESRDDRYVATVIYDAIGEPGKCDGHAHYEIHDLLESSIVAEIDACFQSLRGSFSGFVTDPHVLAYVLRYRGGREMPADSEGLMNKHVTAIYRTRSAENVGDLKAMMLASSPDGERVVLLRIHEPSLEIEMRDAACSQVAWRLQNRVRKVPNVYVVWSTDSKVVALLTKSLDQLEVRVCDAASGETLVWGVIELPSEGWLGPGLLTRTVGGVDPFVGLGVSRAED